MKKALTCLSVIVLSMVLSGCAFKHSGIADPMIRVYPEEGQKPIALIHSETWCPALFYYAKLGNASLEKSQAKLAEAARECGAEAVVQTKNHVEVHMPFPLPFIVGWHEYHVWGTAVAK